MKFFLRLIFLVFIVSLQLGCTHFFSRMFGSFDERVFYLKILNLHNQRNPSDQNPASWQGDWILRRERLSLLDSDLKSSKPDVIMLQEFLIREGSPTENDRNLLNAGSLDLYSWDLLPVETYPDNGEVEYFALAATSQLSLKSLDSENVSSFQKIWRFGSNGVLALHILVNEMQNIAFVNIRMPEDGDVNENFLYVEKAFQEIRDNFGICKQRFVVGGFLPVSSLSTPYIEFLNRNNFKDSSEGNCEIESECTTFNAENQMNLNSPAISEFSKQLDRILLHKDALVYSSKLEFTQGQDTDIYAKSMGLGKIFSGRRFGWGVNFRLPRCD